MAKANVKIKKVGSKKPKAQLIQKQKLGSTAQQKRQALLQERWGAELMSLQEREFPNMAAAVEAIIDSVVARISNGSPSEQAKTRDFLRTLFESDPHLLAELRTLLRIG